MLKMSPVQCFYSITEAREDPEVKPLYRVTQLLIAWAETRPWTLCLVQQESESRSQTGVGFLWLLSGDRRELPKSPSPLSMKDSVLKLVIKEGDNINPALEEREYKYAYEINHSPRDYLCIDVWGAKNYLLKNWVS